MLWRASPLARLPALCIGAQQSRGSLLPCRSLSSLQPHEIDSAHSASSPVEFGVFQRGTPVGWAPLWASAALGTPEGGCNSKPPVAAAELLPRYRPRDVRQGAERHWTPDGQRESIGSVRGQPAVVKSMRVSLRPAAAETVFHEVGPAVMCVPCMKLLHTAFCCEGTANSSAAAREL